MAITMKKYIIKLEGKTYEVEMGEVPAGETVLHTAPTQTQKPAEQGPVSTGETMKAPMPGTIVNVLVSQGQSVQKGQVLLVLEAMKMENEIVAPCSGTISHVAVNKGQAVNVGDVFLSIEA